MNNSPDRNTNNYTDYSLSGNTQQNFAPQRPSNSASQPRAARPANSQPQPQGQHPQGQHPQHQPRPAQPTQPVQQRRPLNDEERRRLEAARMAAMQSGGRMTEEEIRRRRREQQHLNAAQPGANPQRRVEIHNPGAGGTQARQNQQAHAKRNKKKIRINAGAVIFVLLIAGVIGVSAHQLSKNESELPAKNDDNISYIDQNGQTETDDILSEIPDAVIDEPEETDTSSETDSVEEELNLTLYDTVTVLNGTMDEGSLILVNYEYAYADTDTVKLANVYSDRQSKIKVSSTADALTPKTLDALDNMLFGLTADTGCDDLIINSGHRTKAEQQKIYDDYVISKGPEYAKAYVANAGYSEHHTGLACDLSFFTDDGHMIPVAEHEAGWWLSANCTKYGFILRYPKEKIDITKIAYEAWHFRYVGIPHAYACTALDYCFEEYISALTSYTPDTKVLHVKPDGTAADVEISSLPVTGGGWLVYYVPASDGDSTDISLFRGDIYSNYEISGNNAGGFVITVTLP